MQTVNYQAALDLMHENIKSESLRMHCKNVELAMRHFAKKLGEDEEYWAVVGLLHDIDFEKHPDEHCKKSPEILKVAGYDDEFIYSVISHGHNICVDAEPKHIMEKVLYTVDELTGFVTACARVRPDRNVGNVELKSLKKKFKTANFAAAVSREVIMNGCEMLEIPFDEVAVDVIESLKDIEL